MKKEWIALWSNKSYLTVWISLLLLVLCTLKLISLFLIFNENRPAGYAISDWVLNALEPADVSTPLFTITWICIFVGLPVALRTPKRAMIVFISILIMSVLRCFSLYLVPLIPPEGIIPLRDTFLEGSFYENRVLVKDLFFSGHTANLALLTFLVDIKWMKYIFSICTLVVAYLLLKQHVHYTIDVFAAPIAAYIAYSQSNTAVDYIISKISLDSSVQNGMTTA